MLLFAVVDMLGLIFPSEFENLLRSRLKRKIPIMKPSRSSHPMMIYSAIMGSGDLDEVAEFYVRREGGGNSIN